VADRKDLTTQMEATSPASPEPKPKTLTEWVWEQVPQFEKAIGDTVGADRLARIVLTEVRRTPALGKTSIESILGAAMRSAQMRLDPGPLGHCYLVPIKGQCEWWLGYKGMMELARRSGRVGTIMASPIHESDTFRAEAGTGGGLHHQIDYRVPVAERGEIYAWYAYAGLTGGGDQWVVLTDEEVKEYRARSSAWRNDPKKTPWESDYKAMAMKTCVRRLFTWLPTGVESHQALAADGAVSMFDPNRPSAGVQMLDYDASELMPDEATTSA